MANSDKNILITPNVGQTTEPTIKFTGASNTPITMRVLDPGTLSFEGTAGQLFSVADGLTGSLFTVNDISGIPSVEVLDTGLVKLAQYNGSVTIGTGTALQSGGVNAELSIVSATATTPGLIIKGTTSQSANLQEWQNAAGILVAVVQGNGTMRISGASALGAAVNIFTPATNAAAIIAQGRTSQTADLQQLLTATGAVLGGFNALAQTFTGSTAPITVTTGGATTAASGDGTTATITTTSAHGLATGDLVTVAGVTPTGYNGTFLVTGTPSSTQITYANTTTGSQTVAGTVSAPAQSSVTARSAGTVGLVVRNAASQIANIQEWRNSSGTLLAFVGANGTIQTSASGMYAPKFADYAVGTNAVLTMASTGVQATTAVAANVALTIQNTNASPTGDLTQWKDTSSTTLAAMGSSGNFRTTSTVIFGALSGELARVSLYTVFANSVGLVIRGAVSQTANLQQWQSSDGTVLTRIQSNGALVTGTIYASALSHSSTESYGTIYPTTTGMEIRSSVAANIPLTIQNTNASPTGDLTQWKDTSGTVTAKVDSGGGILALNIRTTNNYIRMTETAGGGTLNVTKCTSAPSAAGTDIGRLYFRDGTTAGTLKLVTIAGSGGGETTLFDNIATTGSGTTVTIDGGSA